MNILKFFIEYSKTNLDTLAAISAIPVAILAAIIGVKKNKSTITKILCGLLCVWLFYLFGLRFNDYLLQVNTPQETTNEEAHADTPPETPNGEAQADTPPETPNGEVQADTPPETPNGEAQADTPPETPNGEAQADTPPETPNGEVRILNKNSLHKAEFEKLAKEFSDETGIPVTIETPASNAYSKALEENLNRSPQDPTLFMLGGMYDYNKYRDECLDLTDTSVAGQLTDTAYSLKDENNTIYGLSCNIESFGLAVNTRLLAEAGYSISDIEDFKDLKKIAEDITKRKAQLGFSAFTSPTIGDKARGSYRFSQHAPVVPLYYEVKDNGFKIRSKLNGTYMKQYREYVDLYFENATVSKESAVSRSLEDAQQEFCNGQAVFHQDGSWDADALPVSDIAVIPLYMGMPEEKKQGLCKTCSYYWCVNKRASKDDQEATLQFLYWIVTSEKGLRIMEKEMQFLLPYKEAGIPDNIFIQALKNQEEEGKISIEQYYKYGDDSEWRKAINQALKNYVTLSESWDKVTEAFKNLW